MFYEDVSCGPDSQRRTISFLKLMIDEESEATAEVNFGLNEQLWVRSEQADNRLADVET